MKIQVLCPKCSSELAVPVDAAGKRVRCLKCMTVVRVPGAKSKTVHDDSANDVEDRPKLEQKKAVPRQDRTNARHEDDSKERRRRSKPPESNRTSAKSEKSGGSKSIVLVLVLVVAVGMVAVGSGLGYYFFFSDKTQPEPVPVPVADANSNRPPMDAVLHQSLSGTQWEWGKGIEFKADLDAVNADWKAAGFTVRWDPIDRRTVVVNLERGRAENRLAVLIFSEDRKQFTGYDFEGLTRLNPVKRKGDTSKATSAVSSTTNSVSELRRRLSGTKWDWSDGVLTLQSNGQVSQPAWGGLVTQWEAIDRRTAVLKVTSGRKVNQLAVLRFSEDLSSFSGYEFRGDRFAKTAARISDSPTTPPITTPKTPIESAVRPNMVGKWVRKRPDSLGASLMFEFRKDGVYVEHERAEGETTWKIKKKDDKFVWSVEDEKTLKIKQQIESGGRILSVGVDSFQIDKVEKTELTMTYRVVGTTYMTDVFTKEP